MFNTLFYNPIYNLLVIYLNLVPNFDIGLSIILVTLTVKTILLPIGLSAARTQYKLKQVQSKIEEIREKFKNNQQEMGLALMKIYKEEQIKPLSSLLAIILQIPVFFAIYMVFSKGIHANAEAIYSFVHFPEILNNLAFGIIDVTAKHWWLGILAGYTSYLLTRRQLALTQEEKDKLEEKELERKKTGKMPSFQDELSRTMRLQMTYVLPVIVGFSGAVLPGALAFYFITGNLFSIAQDIYIKRKLGIKTV